MANRGASTPTPNSATASSSSTPSSSAATPAVVAPPPHLVDMNVMRLFAEPTLSKLPITHAVDGAQDGGIGLTSMLSLPTAFGEIYLGQTFNCYVNIVNNSQTQDIEIVSLTADLSFPVMRSNGSKATQKVELKDARAKHSRNPAQAPVTLPGSVVAPGKSVDLLIEHELLREEYRYAPDAPKKAPKSSKGGKGKGLRQRQPESTFQLLVVVVYKTTGGGDGADGDGGGGNNDAGEATAAAGAAARAGRERRLKRWFKFGVRKPFQETYRTSAVGDRTVVEVQLQNLCSTPVVVRDVAFTAGPGFRLVDAPGGSSAAAAATAAAAPAPGGATAAGGGGRGAAVGAASGDGGERKQGASDGNRDDDNAFGTPLGSPTVGAGQARAAASDGRRRLDEVVCRSLDMLQDSLLAPGAFKRRLFVLAPAGSHGGGGGGGGGGETNEQQQQQQSDQVPRLGSLHVDWSGPMGESSRLVFASLKCHVKSALPVEVTARLADPSARVVYGQPFTVALTIRNKSELAMPLSLRVPLSTFAPVAPLNMLQEQLGTLPLRGTIERRVEMMPLANGPYKIDGIVVMDNKRNKYLARPLSVFVNAE